ncbi:MAG: hypothetical protein LC119_05695 [Burkholderiales bacterium]|nr:hypothetical protein [Burkholderiales bacterium]
MTFEIGPIVVGHNRFLTGVGRILTRELDAAGRFALTHVHAYADFKHRTGATSRATKYRVVGMATKRTVRLSNARRVATFLEYGTKPHIIRARRKQFLRFTVRGRVVFARRVRHPGTKPYRFLYNATDAAGRVLIANLRSDLATHARRF